MRKKLFKRVAASALAFMMVAQSASGIVVASADTQSQMASDKEVVYVNSYGTSTREQNFDDNWKFYLGEASGAESNAYDDSAWGTVNLPHDYSIEQEYSKQGEAESAYLLGGTGWYRKHFTVAPEMEGKSVRIDFGGVYMNATVWVNGTQLGTHPFGYTPFSFDISDYLDYEGENVITVKVDHKTPSSRWYSGSGIYRSVNLVVMDEVHVDLFGTKVDAPNLKDEAGKTVNVSVETTVANDGEAAADVVLTHTIYEKGTENAIGTVTTDAVNVKAGAKAEIDATLPAENPALWDTVNPNLYTIVTEVKVGDAVVDTYETEYGFRYIAFDTETGFYLNGEPLKLKGVCMHHDQGSLGSEAHYRAIERQVEILQEMGCNSIRVTHNPAADELIEICNEKGILVIDEFFDGWMRAKNTNYNDYSVWFQRAIESGNRILGAESGMTWAEFDLKATIGRGENAPSVIMWSLGNEIQEGAGGSGYSAVADDLIQWCQETETTKLLTIGSNAVKNAPGNNNNEHIQIANKITAVGGASGTNYSKDGSYDQLHNADPDWFLYGSETASHVNSRGVYDYIGGSSQTADKELTSYDYSAVPWGATASSAWYDVITRDFVAGEYVWTGFDYMGEPTPWNGTGTGVVGSWPSPKNSYFGIIDTAGLPKDNYYFYQSQWNDDVTTLHVLPAWNEDVVNTNNAKGVPVVVYSDAASVKLTLTTADGQTKDLGTKEFTQKTTAAGYTYQIYEGSDKQSAADRNLYLTWYVPFEEGTLTATAYDKDGNVIEDTVGRSFVATTGDEAALTMTADAETVTANGKDLIYVQVDVVDEDGNIVPNADDQVTFKVEGSGTLVGVDNGKQADHQSFQDDNRAAYNGSLIAIVQTAKEAGDIKITASASGLTSASVTVKAEDAGDSADVSFYMSRNYYVQAGVKPVLPATIETRYADGTSEELPVVWADIAEDSYKEAGTFAVSGVVDGLYSVSVTINVLEEVGGLLNYSTTTTVGTAPTLPTARPVVLVDGTILEASFAVEWDEVTGADFEEAGNVIVNGTASVFGKEYNVETSVRVQDVVLDLGDNVAPAAAEITQDIEEALQSDTLMAIIDGSTTVGDNNDGGPNETAWSNYDNSQAGDNKAELVFKYDTQQQIGQIVIYFWRDGYSAEFPEAGTTEIYLSEDGTNWTKLDAKETIGTEESRVKPYTYSFEPTTATFIKFAVTNSTAQKTAKPCTGITEIVINRAEGGSVAVNTTAGFETLTINGTPVTEKDLERGYAYCPAAEAELVVEGKGNAAVTVLPVYNNQIVIITESEDHAVRETFTILVGQTEPIDPADDSKDYPVADMTITTGSEQPGTGQEGPVKLAFDGDENTFWHSEWNPSWFGSESCDKHLWVQMTLKNPAEITALRYLPRGGNGDITSYRVEGSADGETWKTLAEGEFERDGEWKVVSFAATELKAVRFVAKATYADSSMNKFASAREIRLVEVKKECAHETELKDAAEATCTEDGYTGDEVCKLCGTVVKKGTAIKAAGHKLGEWKVVKEATCTEDGSKEAKCENCVYVETEAIKAAGHAWGEWTVTKEATVEEEGIEQRTCGNCNKVEERAIDKLDPPAWVNPFKDVAEGKYYYEPVAWGSQNGIVNGLKADEFGPKAECTRGQIVTFIWRAMGKPAAENAENKFTDVVEGKYYYDAVIWAVEKGIVNGLTDTTFGPEETCTRAQMATFLYRHAGEPAPAAACPFPDVAAGKWYTNAATWASEQGIVTGYEDGTFGTNDKVLREQTVTMLYRYFAK